MTAKTLQDLVAALPARGRRRAVGVRRDFGARWWTYRQLYEAACAAAAVLRDRGVEPGQRVVLWSGNRPEWTASFLGAALRGVAVVPVDEGASLEQARRIAAEVDAVLVLHGDDQDGEALGLPSVPLGTVAPVCGTSHAALAVPLDPDAEAVILFTSGTTARPRGVILTHRNLAAQLSAFKSFLGLARLGRFRLLVLAPLSHSQGLLLGICMPLWIGVSVLYSGSIDPAHLVRTIRDNRVTVLSTVPRVAQTLGAALRRMPLPGRRGGTIESRTTRARFGVVRRLVTRNSMHKLLGRQFRALIIGGADLSRADEQFWRQAGCMVVQGYGMTETAAIVSVNLPWQGRFGSIGRPLPHLSVDLAPDGEILVRGASVATAYLGGDRADGEAVEDGVLRTGDLGMRDARGRLYFVGRKKDVIVTGEGFNVYPDEVEAVLREMTGVRDAVVLGVEQGGTVRVHAELLLHDGADVGRIVHLANAKLEPHQVIRSWNEYPGEDFPRTSLLKVRRQEVAEQVRAGVAPAVEEPAPTLEAILALGDRERRLRLLAGHLVGGGNGANGGKGANGAGGRTLREIGLTSLETVELLSLVEAKTGVPLDRVEVSADANLGDLSALVASQAPSPRAKGAGGAAGASATAAADAESRLPVGPPPWARRPVGRLLRRLAQPAIARLWALRWGRPAVSWPEGRPALAAGPMVVAVAPHRHFYDGFAMYLALPRKLRRRLVVVTNYRFDEASAPTRAQGRRRRARVRLMYRLLLPLSFDFVILPHSGTTRYGLYDLGRLIDSGKSPLTFPKGLYMSPDDLRRHDPGVAMIALETQTPVLPVWLEDNDGFDEGKRRRVDVRIGRPIPVSQATSREELIGRIESAFEELAR